jgi:hypothetical protein
MAEQLEGVATPPLEATAAVWGLIEKLALDVDADIAKLERIIAMYERLKAKEGELAFNAAKGRILNKLVRVRIVKNRSALCETENCSPPKNNS